MNPALIIAVVAVTSLVGCSPEPVATATTPAPTSTAESGSGLAAPAMGIITGAVAETMNSGGYTYARLQSGSTESWIAASELQLKAGDRISATVDMPMDNFTSKSLDRNFPLIYFVNGVTRDGAIVPATASAPALAGSHEPAQAGAAAPMEPIQPEPGGTTIAGLWAQRKALSGKVVVVRGKVVKVNNGIMGSNWIHLQDGSGTAKDGTNDLVVTTNARAKVGDIVTVTGRLATDKDFGSGYAYDAIVENATVLPSKAANN